MASEAPSSDISSVFSKKKGKKGKRAVKGSNLNIDSGITKPEEKPKLAQMQEILGGPDPSEDDGWTDVVEKKSVVATGGKQVSDLIDMSTLMTGEESTARKLEKKDIKQAFHDARTVKEAEKKEAPEVVKEEAAEEQAKPKGLSGNIFGGGAGRPGGLTGGWQARMQERELKQREQALSVENTFAFPSLADAMSEPAKPKPGAGGAGGGGGGGAADDSRWVRRAGGSSAASAAIRAALGRQGDDAEEVKKSDGGMSASPAPVKVTPPPPASSPAPESAAPEDPDKPPAPPAEEGKSTAATGEMEGAVATDGGVEGDGEGEAKAAVETDKDALVQQFGKKKKKKKKPVEEKVDGDP